ncbi:MAG: glycosyltransferase family 4 protein [Planctomycetes bacterium]|nr:glycosyltransferase family 4 protein [Planctomycetota bacterium]
MRVAHVITRMIIGGAQENTLYTCLDLMRIYGDEVLLVTGPQTGPEGSLLERAKGEGVPLAILPPLRREIRPAADVAAYRAIKRTLREFRPDVVHTHSAKGGVLGRAAAHALGVRAIIHTVHGAPFHPYQDRGVRAVYRACERFAAKRCHAIVSVADAMTDLMVNAGVAPRGKFTTIYSGMEVEPFLAADEQRDAVRQELGFAAEHVVVGKIARLFHLKGHEYLIRAARPVIERHPQVRFLLVGDGILRTQLERQIAEEGLSEHFRFTGLVPPAQIPPLIGTMDIVVHASLREGLARALPQALIAGKPVVSYDIDGAREVAIPEETGFLLPPQSVAPMVEALCQLAGDADLRRRMGGEGRRRFTDVFRHETMTRRLRELYQQVLSR